MLLEKCIREEALEKVTSENLSLGKTVLEKIALEELIFRENVLQLRVDEKNFLNIFPFYCSFLVIPLNVCLHKTFLS